MTTLRNEIIVNAPIEKIWEALSEIERLQEYDPLVKKSVAISAAKSGMDAKRKVDMKDGKNWFEEKVVVFKPHESLAYQLTDCSFPIHGLKHSYSFEKLGEGVQVRQVMEYRVKFGFLGRIMDALMIRKQTDRGVKAFFQGLKSYLEQN